MDKSRIKNNEEKWKKKKKSKVYQWKNGSQN